MSVCCILQRVREKGFSRQHPVLLRNITTCALTPPSGDQNKCAFSQCQESPVLNYCAGAEAQLELRSDAKPNPYRQARLALAGYRCAHVRRDRFAISAHSVAICPWGRRIRDGRGRGVGQR